MSSLVPFQSRRHHFSGKDGANIGNKQRRKKKKPQKLHLMVQNNSQNASISLLKAQKACRWQLTLGISSAYFPNTRPAILQAPSAQNAATKACAFYFISDGNGAYKLQNAYTGNYWPAPTGNARLYPATAANAGSWAVSISNGAATLTCTNVLASTKGVK